MNPKLQNVASLFRNTRTRTIILFTGGVLLLGVIIGLVKLAKQNSGGPEASAQVRGAPNIQSVPGGFGGAAPSAEYAQLQEQQNVMQAKIAEQQGTSAIPTIIRASNFGEKQGATGGAQGCCNPCPCGPTKGKFPLQASNLRTGTLIYDANGKVIGTLGADGKVRNVDGQVIGTVGPDGLVRDSNGNVIGSAGTASANGLVYDAQGHLIGKVGADGKVRDANGKVIGTVDPDGTVRDANGNIIGKVAPVTTPEKPPVVGTPVYDSQGRLIGTVGPNGKVIDANGKVIGTVGADGVVRDANGKVIGKTGPTAPGTPVYDAQGRLIGTVGADGTVRDANGKVIGTVGLDGVVRDADGNEIGSTNPGGAATQPATSSASTQLALPGSSPTANPELKALLARQAAQVSAQQAEQLRQQMQGAIAGQANQLMGAWVSPTQQYVAGTPPTEKGAGGAGGSGSAGSSGAGGGTGTGGGASGAAPVVKAGTIMYAVLITAVDSDEPGPVLATIVSGKFKGGRLMGGLTNQGEKVLLSFNTLSLPDVSSTVQVNAVAIDENTARTAFSSYTDQHYWMRYGLLFASSFLQGMGQAVSQSGQQLTSNGLQVTTTNPSLTTGQQALVALGQVGTQFSAKLGAYFNTPPTVHVYSGTPMGVLFLADVPPLPQ